MSETITIPKLHCKRCGHEWVPRVTDVKTCPNCRSPYWDTPKVQNHNLKEKSNENQ